MREQMFTPEETHEFFQIMQQARSDAQRRWFRRTEVAMHRALQFLVAGGTPYHCTAGDRLITVGSNGDLYPCRRMPIHVGNLLETSLAELYYESDLFRALRDRSRISDGCDGCMFTKLCRGGLKCLSYAVNGDPFTADPGCWLHRDPGGSKQPMIGAEAISLLEKRERCEPVIFTQGLARFQMFC
jgi:radical SAM protein with 4Fe4S-binding SPASM domain